MFFTLCFISGADDVHIKFEAERAAQAATYVAAGRDRLSGLMVADTEERINKASPEGLMTVITDGASLMLMLTALIIMFIYVQQVNRLAEKAVSKFQIYDAVGYASANVFMLQKSRPPGAGSSTPYPGEPGRYVLTLLSMSYTIPYVQSCHSQSHYMPQMEALGRPKWYDPAG